MSGSFPDDDGSAAETQGEPLVMPGSSDRSKLPVPRLPESLGQATVPEELRSAWTGYMIRGFKQNEQMFQKTLDAFIKPYRLTVWLYISLFAVGFGLFVMAVLLGLRNGPSLVAVSFGGLSVLAFLTFFLRQPLHALEENLEFITWLGVAFNTYWTRLMYLSDPETIQVDLKSAENDFRASIEKLIAEHAKLRGKRRDVE